MSLPTYLFTLDVNEICGIEVFLLLSVELIVSSVTVMVAALNQNVGDALAFVCVRCPQRNASIPLLNRASDFSAERRN